MSDYQDEPGPSADTPLIPAQRREMILRQLRRQRVLSVNQLTEILKCSHMTVRRDIAILEQEGRAFSVPGGVRIANQVYSEPSHQTKVIAEQQEKQRMAPEAAKLMRPDMTIYLDAGTTTFCLLPFIQSLSGITVITNDLSIVLALADTPHVEVIQTGGILDHNNRSFVGGLAAATMNNLVADLAFISASSWDLQHGVTTPSALKIDVKKAVINSSSRNVLMATSSKYGTFGMYRVTSLDSFDTIITDTGLTEDAAKGIRKLGVELILA